MSKWANSVVLAAVLFGAIVCGVSAQSLTGAYGFQTILNSYVGGGGTAHAYLDMSASVLVVAAQWTGLTGTPSAMHIHGCLPAPATLYNSSGVIIDLSSSINLLGLGTTGETLMTFDLTQTTTYKWTSTDTAANQAKALLNCLVNGTAYYNIHTTLWPNGELSGIFQQTTQVNASWTTLTAQTGVTTSATGKTNFLYNANTHEVFIGATFAGLTSNASGIHWHGCASNVVNATTNYIIKLNPPNALGTISASFVNYYDLLNTSSYLHPGFANLTMNSPLVAEQTIWQCLINGSTTLNIHNSLNPNGEITGWYKILNPIQPIVPSPDALTTYTSLLTSYAIKGGAGSAVGYAAVSLDLNTQIAEADVTIFSPLTGAVTQAHIHGCTPTTARYPFSTTNVMVPLIPSNVGPLGEFQNVYSTGVIDTYQAAFLQAAGVSQAYQAETLVYNCLQNEQTYLNLHTLANSAGEAAGVLTPSNQVVVLTAVLGPTNNTVPATAKGVAYLVWDMAAHLLWVNVTYSGLTSLTLTMAHIHGCLPNTGVAIPLNVNGANGQIIQSINTALTSSYDPTYYVAGTQWPPAWYAEKTFATCLLNNSLYVNLHTTAFVNGEVKGTILLDTDNLVPSTAPHQTTGTNAAIQFTLSMFSVLMPVAMLLALLTGSEMGLAIN